MVAQQRTSHDRGMKKLTSILVVIERGTAVQHALRKACIMARHFGARLELFLCEAEQAYALRHAYDRRGVEEARDACLAQARNLLDALRKSVAADDIVMDIDAVCESPLHEAIVRKVLRSKPDLVVKSLVPDQGGRHTCPTGSDWQLVRTCPVPLMLTRSQLWQPQPRFAAAVDISPEEFPGLARTILRDAEYLSEGCAGMLDVVHAAPPGVRRDARDALEHLASEFRVKDERVHVVEGEPVRALPEFVKAQEYDVLVMGALTHERHITPLVGTLSSNLIETLECDFVVVKPDTFSTPVVGSQRMSAAPAYGVSA
jgi:universal stress protein E